MRCLALQCPSAASMTRPVPRLHLRRGTAHIGTKMLYLPAPEPLVWIVPVTSILGRLPLLPVGDTGTIPLSMASKIRCKKLQCFPEGASDRTNASGSGSHLFYINTWAMVCQAGHQIIPYWLSDSWKIKHAVAVMTEDTVRVH